MQPTSSINESYRNESMRQDNFRPSFQKKKTNQSLYSKDEEDKEKAMPVKKFEYKGKIQLPNAIDRASKFSNVQCPYCMRRFC